MKKATIQNEEKVESKGRRGVRKGAAKRAELTVGDLVAAAYDALESEARDVMRVLSSPTLAAAIRRRIVLV
jgi:hypothetical protein